MACPRAPGSKRAGSPPTVTGKWYGPASAGEPSNGTRMAGSPAAMRAACSDCSRASASRRLAVTRRPASSVLAVTIAISAARVKTIVANRRPAAVSTATSFAANCARIAGRPSSHQYAYARAAIQAIVPTASAGLQNVPSTASARLSIPNSADTKSTPRMRRRPGSPPRASPCAATRARAPPPSRRRSWRRWIPVASRSTPATYRDAERMNPSPSNARTMTPIHRRLRPNFRMSMGCPAAFRTASFPWQLLAPCCRYYRVAAAHSQGRLRSLAGKRPPLLGITACVLACLRLA